MIVLNVNPFRNKCSNRKKEINMQSALINYEYNEMCYTNGQTNLDEETVYSSIYLEIKYDDLKEAHENSVIPVLEKTIEKYNTLDELKGKTTKYKPFNQEQSNNILRDNKITEGETPQIEHLKWPNKQRLLTQKINYF